MTAASPALGNLAPEVGVDMGFTWRNWRRRSLPPPTVQGLDECRSVLGGTSDDPHHFVRLLRAQEAQCVRVVAVLLQRIGIAAESPIRQ
eukprot:CAMPEP_0170413916 /NCGR_PEP_ID=MMETSP0117_2-20130122/31788_1 /TAXON_ID=400756 /ORGANISM="Durinskia baltica, Strain CSIRO CS-38" /LENGTH=88 /DNA_ID=CAMNT_0010671767 /DNA_START=30 /DNA_END=297 /DNA_ORIENTATION=+